MAVAGSVFARDDTLFGVCHALGEDFGFNPTYLRILFACGLFGSPAVAIGGYAALGALVAFSRWVAPEPGSAGAEPVDAPEVEEREELRLAA